MIIENVNGWDVKISTSKNYQNIISCSAQFGTVERRNGWESFTSALMSDPSIVLAQAPKGARATEKTLKEISAAGLLKFEAMRAAGELPTRRAAYEIQIGQILFLNGYDQDEHHHNRKAVYEMAGKNVYKTVCLDTFNFETIDHVKPIEEKFGIGIYYKQGDTATAEEIAEAIQKATQKAEQFNKDQEEKRQTAATDRAEKISKGAEVLQAIPDGFTHVIVANLMEDDSDPQTDYFSSHSVKTVYLAFSKHGRDLFDEMRKAAANCPDEGINKYSVKPATEDGEAPEDEHREKYSMGAGYYLGSRSRSGWKISKSNIDARSLESLQIAIAEERYFIPTEAAQEPAANFAPAEVPAGKVQIVDYSEKAIAVIGETKPLKDKLKDLGGRFNFRLTCGAGWIFPKTKLEEVKAAILGQPISKEAQEILRPEWEAMEAFLNQAAC